MKNGITCCSLQEITVCDNMVWYLQYNGTSYPIADISYYSQLDGLNYANVQVNYNGIPNDAIANLMWESTVVFAGFVKQVVDPDDEITKYSITEQAVELRDFVCEDNGSYEVTFENTTVSSIVSQILTGTSWAASGLGSSYETQVVSNMTLYYANALDALFKLLRIYCNAKVWFSPTSKVLYYSDSRTNHGSISYNLKTPSKSSEGRNINKVIVLGKSDDIVGTAGTGAKTQVYRYTECTSNEVAATIAASILSEVNTVKTRVEVTLPPSINYVEGDLVTVDGVSYLVTDVTVTYTETVLGLGASKVSIFDQYQGMISQVSGTVTIDDSDYAKLSENNVFAGENTFNTGTLFNNNSNRFVALSSYIVSAIAGSDLQLAAGEGHTIKLFAEDTPSEQLEVTANGIVTSNVMASGMVTLDGEIPILSDININQTGGSVLNLNVPTNGLVRIRIG